MRRIATLTLVLMLLLPASALASGNSTCQAYNPQTCSSVGGTQTQTRFVSNTTVNTSTAKTLPFTGLDAFLLVGGGATLLAAGLGVRVLSRRLS